MHGREAHAVAFAELLGREERLEQPLVHVRLDAAAFVQHGEAHVEARHHRHPQVFVALVQDGIRRHDAELATRRHRVARIGRQVGQQLVELHGIDVHAAQIRREIEVDLHFAGGSVPQQLLHVAQDAIEIKDNGLRRLLAAERHQLARQRGRLHRRGANAGEVGLGRIVLLQVAAHEVGQGQDDGHQVVEIVSDAACQPAHRLQALEGHESVARLTLALLRDARGERGSRSRRRRFEERALRRVERLARLQVQVQHREAHALVHQRRDRVAVVDHAVMAHRVPIIDVVG